jgi:hypothetical protein
VGHVVTVFQIDIDIHRYGYGLRLTAALVPTLQYCDVCVFMLDVSTDSEGGGRCWIALCYAR